MNSVIDWITASAHWTGDDGVPHRLILSERGQLIRCGNRNLPERS